MSDTNTISFTKMNGQGNEILVVDLRGKSKVFQPAEVREIAQAPHTRFDQMMVLHDPRTPGTQAFVKIYNADGSLSGACGNGTRCIGWHLRRQGDDSNLIFETQTTLLKVKANSIDNITVDMGEPKFNWDEIPLAEEFHDTRRIELQIGPIDNPILHTPSVVNIGNPHAIFWVEDVEAIDLGRMGPLLENHPIFPQRANISIAHVRSRQEIIQRTWERGTGLTKACGSGACASAVSAMRNGFTERTVTVHMPGGPLQITWEENNHISLSGPVVVEYEGILGHLPAQ